MEEESGEIRNLNRHYTVEEVFRPKTKQVRGFIEKNYHKGLHSQAFYEINIVLSGEACQQLIGPDGSSASGRYQRILPLCAGRYAFQTFDDNYENIRCGLLTSDGAELLPAAYDDILPAGDDRLILVDGDEVVFADAAAGRAVGQAF